MPIALLALLQATSTAGAARHPICKQDLSTVNIAPIHGLLAPPADAEERALRPGLVSVQADVCRCLPRRRRHQPDGVLARLHIAPNRGEVRVSYQLHTNAEPARAVGRMQACLGMPTLLVEPMPYRSDMLDGDGQPLDEVLVYPLLLKLTYE